MRLLFFDDYRLGVLRDSAVIDVSGLVSDIPRAHPQDIIASVIERWSEFAPRFVEVSMMLRRRTRGIGPDLSAAAAASEYRLHGPQITSRMGLSLIGHQWVPEIPELNHRVWGCHGTSHVPATIFEGEAELAVVIGRRAGNVPASEAMDYVFGYTNLIDGSARGLPPEKNASIR